METPKDHDFFRIPNHIFNLGLNAAEIAVYCAIAQHGGENNVKGIFPGRLRLQRMTNLGRTTVREAINVLKACNMITSKQAKTGVKNQYFLIKYEVWKAKGGGSLRDLVKVSTEASRAFNQLGRHATRTRSPGDPGVGRQAAPNNTKLNHTKNNGPNFDHLNAETTDPKVRARALAKIKRELKKAASEGKGKHDH